MEEDKVASLNDHQTFGASLCGWRSLVAALEESGDDTQQRRGVLVQLDQHARLLKHPEKHRPVVTLDTRDIQVIVQGRLYSVLKIANLNPDDMQVLLPTVKSMMKGTDFGYLACFAQVIRQMRTEDLVLAVKASPGLALLSRVVEIVPDLPLPAFTDQLKSALNSEKLVEEVLRVLHTSTALDPIFVDLYSSTKAARSRLGLLSLLRDREIGAALHVKLFEWFKKETVEASGEVLAGLISRNVARIQPELLNFLAEGVKSAKPKPFVLKTIFFAELEERFAGELKQLLAKEVKSPSSNDTLMTLVAVLGDGSGASVAQRAGFFLNDLFVVSDGRCALSIECQMILLKALTAVLEGKLESGKAGERFMELCLHGHRTVVSAALQFCSHASPAVLRGLVPKMGLYAGTACEPKLRRLVLAIIQGAKGNGELERALFFALVKPRFRSLGSVSSLASTLRPSLDFGTVVSMAEEDFGAVLPYVELEDVEEGFRDWFHGLPEIGEGHVAVWSTPERADPPTLPTADVKKKDADKGTKRPGERKLDARSTESQMEEERGMRRLAQDLVDKLNKTLLLFQHFTAQGKVVAALEDTFEAILSMSKGAYGKLAGRQLTAMFKLIGGGRLLVAEGVRFADWLIAVDRPDLLQYSSMDDPVLASRKIDSIHPMLSRHPRPLIVFLESFVQSEESIESVRGALLYIQSHPLALSSFAGRGLLAICRAASRFEALAGECFAAVQCLASPKPIDTCIVHDLLMGESDTGRRLALQFISQWGGGDGGEGGEGGDVHKELSVALFILGRECPATVEALLEYLLRYKHLSETISKAICRLIKSQDAGDFVPLFIAQYRRLVSLRTPEGPQERVRDIDLTSDERALIGRILSFSDTALPESSLLHYLTFVMDEALCDPSPVSGDPAGAFFESTRTVLTSCRSALLLLPLIEARLAVKRPQSLSSLPLERQDMYKTWLIVMMAILSGQLPPSDPGRGKVLAILEHSLATPSEAVQMAVADGMVPLVGGEYDSRPLYDRLTVTMTQGKSMAARRGAAFGLGALFRANGLALLFAHGFVEKVLLPALQSSSKSAARQGGLFGVEMLARYLGDGLFEPLLGPLLPSLLSCYSDAKTEVREAAMDATAAIVSAGLSVHTVKTILPVLFEPLDSPAGQWRSRVAALEWLGSMAGIRGRRALAVYLPQIVPRLTGGLAEAHAQVQRAAREALMQYGRVLRNPEIQRLFPVVLAALADPPSNTAKCLERIIETSFTHVVDGPSLALLEPILTRALTDRLQGGTQSASPTVSVDVKKRAAQIIGNLGSIIDPAELIPCLPGLTCALMRALGDPVPEVRSIAARVLGILSRVADRRKTRVMVEVERECILAVICPDPAAILGRIDRAGRAQAAAEIFAHSHGPSSTATLLATAVSEGGLRPDSASDHVPMEGFIRLIGYLPSAFAAQHQSEQLYEEAALEDMFGMILQEMLPVDPDPASLVDGWREACEQTLRLLIAHYCLHDPMAVFHALVTCVSSLFVVPRVRLLAWKLLLEEFLGRVFPPSDRDIAVDDQTAGAAAVLAAECPTGQELMTLLPEDDVQRLQAAAFLGRFDPYASIRTVSSGIWKALSEHPVRVVLATLPSIVQMVSRVAESEEGQAQSLSECYLHAVKELLERMADRVCIPLLELLRVNVLTGDIGTIRVASCVCSCLAQPALQLTKLQRDTCHSLCVDILDAALSASATFPAQASECGESLFPLIADSLGMERVVSALSAAGLQGLVRTRPDLVLPILLPSLQQSKDLDLIEQIANGATAALSQWAFALLSIVVSGEGVSEEVSERHLKVAERIIAHCVVGEEQVRQCVELLADHKSIRSRLVSMLLTRKDRHFDYLVYPFIGREHHEVALQRTMAPGALLPHLRDMDQSASLLSSFVTRCVIPVLSGGGHLAERTDVLDALLDFDLSALPPTVVAPLTGTLIRILSDRLHCPDELRARLHQCVGALCKQAPASSVKPFHPQLQRVLVSALNEQSACDALLLLHPQLARPQSLLSELDAVVSSGTETEAKREKARHLLSLLQQ